MEKDNEIDQLFRRELSEPEIPFNELDWEKMAGKLDAQKKKRIVPLWILTLSGVAAVLAVVLLWIFSKPEITSQQPGKDTMANAVPTVKKSVKDSLKAQSPDIPVLKSVPEHFGKTSEKDPAAEQLAASKQTGLPVADGSISVKSNAGSSVIPGTDAVQAPDGLLKKGLGTTPVYASSGLPAVTGNTSVKSVPAVTGSVLSGGSLPLKGVPANGVLTNGALASNGNLKGNPASGITPPAKLDPHPVPQQTDSDALLLQKANALAQSKDPFERVNRSKAANADRDELTRSIQKKMDAAIAQDHNLILSAMAAPDISTAKDSKSSRLSSNVGMLATYALGKKFSLTSGAVYAKKYYNSGGNTPQGYSAPAGTTWEVDADCNVLDIPLNVNYKVLDSKKLSVSFNTGLSSYFMLKEKYQFITAQPDGGQKVSSLEINNQNQHLFGIANVSVSFDHQITNSMSVGVQPFAKLPLTGIGNGNANLKSVGVSVSLSIGLFPAKKPGKYASINRRY